MSFSLTAELIVAGTKTVTRRLGWLKLKGGDLVRPVRRIRGLRRGEKLEPLRPPLRIVSVRRERLDRMLLDPDYGEAECIKEGFGDAARRLSPAGFVAEFCATHKPCTPASVVTRIEFAYT